MKVKLSFFLFIFILNCHLVSGLSIVNKIIYKKVLIKYSQQSIVNVFFNPINQPIKEIFIYFNNDEITDINRNLKPYIENQNNFSPSISFELENVNSENVLEIFVVLKNDMTLSYEQIIYFEKGIIVQEDNFIIKKNQIFFVKVGDYSTESIYYTMIIDNTDIINKLEEIIFEGELYYRLKSKRSGNTKIKIFKYDESLENQSEFPFRVINITSK